MKYPSVHIKLSLVLLACSAAAMLNACLKTSDAPATPALSLPFKGTDLASTLAQETSLQLFNRAFKRVSMEQQIQRGRIYGICAHRRRHESSRPG